MNSFKSFLALGDNLTAKDAADLIKKNCSYFLEESKFDSRLILTTGLWRGFDSPKYIFNSCFGESKVNKNRKPLTMPIELHYVLDDYFKRESGTNFRSQSIFCTGSYTEAKAYGEPHLVFPKGKFKIAWSSSVRDAYVSFAAPKAELTPHTLDTMLKVNSDLYQFDDLYSAIKSKNEIMVACDSYYYIKYDFDSIKTINNIDSANDILSYLN